MDVTSVSLYPMEYALFNESRIYDNYYDLLTYCVALKRSRTFQESGLDHRVKVSGLKLSPAGSSVTNSPVARISSPKFIWKNSGGDAGGFQLAPCGNAPPSSQGPVGSLAWWTQTEVR